MSKLIDIFHSSGKVILLVLGAFLVMTVASSFYVSSVMKKQIDLHGRSELLLYEAYMRTLIEANEDALINTASVIRWGLRRDAPDEEILEDIRTLSNTFKTQHDIRNIFRSVYGIVDGKYIDIHGVIPADQHRSNPMLQLTFDSPSDLQHTVSYIDPDTKQAVAAISMKITDQDGKGRGLIVLDFLLQPIVDEVRDFKVADLGFGILMDSSFKVLTFPDQKYVGEKIDEIPGFAGITDVLGGVGADIITERYVVSGEEHIGFFGRLENGWYLGILAPLAYYYEEVSSLFPVILGISLILAGILCVVLVRLSMAKSRSEEENRLKTSFLAKMSHEIRTPMNAIIGLSELAQRDYGGSDALNYIYEIKTAGENLLGIINDILDFSKIESGKLEIHPAPYNPAKLLNDVLSMANSRIRDKGLMLQTEIADDIPEKLYGDERCIRQVLINLLSNAIKYTAEGFVMLRVGSVRLPEDVIRLSFAVEDSGIGIKKENLESVFHEFQRPSQRVKNTYVEGTGLGLPIAQSYCRLMGGEVTVRSVYGQGSTFTATILQKVLSQSPMDLLAYQAEMRKREERFVPFIAPDVEMLVVDDIETNLMVASGLLAPFQFKVFTCKSGEEALNLAKGKRFDLMLIDHMMPKMDGVETLKRLRESQYGQKGVPAIAFTANAIVGTRDKLLSKGFDDFISKPIDSDGLATLLQKWVPKERQLPPPQEKGAKDYISDDDALTIGLPIIEGVDTQAGYHRSGGTTSKYLALLKVFRHDARAAIDNLEREAEGNPKLDDLSVIFHGMKSASGNIGAKDFSDRALKLELKAKSEDRAYLTKDRILAFRDRLIKLLGAIEKGVEDFGRDNKIYLSDQGAEREGLGNGGNGDFLEREPQAIMELKDALEQKDVGKADRLLEELDKGSTDERRKLYQEASDLVLVSDFQGALDIINKVNKDVNYGSTNI